MTIEKQGNYYIATHSGTEYMGYSHSEALHRALSANKKNHG